MFSRSFTFKAMSMGTERSQCFVCDFLSRETCNIDVVLEPVQGRESSGAGKEEECLGRYLGDRVHVGGGGLRWEHERVSSGNR